LVTRNDVARLANVSPSVVSYVVNNSNYVSAEKREAVLAAIEKLGYVPNQSAKNLRMGRTKMMAVVRGSQFDDMFNDLLYYMEGFAYEKDYHTALVTIIRDNEGYSTTQYVESLISRQYDAIFIANSSMTESQLNYLAKSGTKVLLYVTRDYKNLDPSISQITPYYRKGVKELVEKMIDLGHRRITLLPNLHYPNSFLSVSNHRFAGYLDALKEHSLPLQMELIPPYFNELSDIKDYLYTVFTKGPMSQAPTAIIANSVYAVNYMIKTLRGLGLRVPEDVSVAALTNSMLASLSTPAITTIGFEVEQVAKLAVDMIVNMIENNVSENRLIDLELTERESLAIPRKD